MKRISDWLGRRSSPGFLRAIRGRRTPPDEIQAVFALEESFPGSHCETTRGTLRLPASIPVPVNVWLLTADGERHSAGYTILNDTLEPVENELPDGDAIPAELSSPAETPSHSDKGSSAGGTPAEGASRGKSADAARKLTRVIAFSLRPPVLEAGTVLFAETEQGEPLSGSLSIDDNLIREVRERGRSRTVNAENDPGYDEWFRSRRIGEAAREKQAGTSLPWQPLISLVVPLDATPVDQLYELVESVVSQTYRCWSLVFVPSTPDQALADALADVQRLCPQTQIVNLLTGEPEGTDVAGDVAASDIADATAFASSHADATAATAASATANAANAIPAIPTPSAALNAGIAAAPGDVIGILDPTLLLEPDALFEVARALNKDPNRDLLYCDEDVLTADGRFTRPFFKPDFSLDLLRATNYLGDFLIVSAPFLKTLGPRPFNPDAGETAVHEFLLRASDRTHRIHHIDKMLCHRRMPDDDAPGEGTPASAPPTGTPKSASPTSAPTSKSPVPEALRRYFEALPHPATVSPGPLPRSYDVRYRVPEPAPLVSIVIPNKDQITYLDRCIRSIEALTTYPRYEIVVVENNSTEPETFAFYETLRARSDRVRIEHWPGSFNFSEIVNTGVQAARGEYLVLLNNDTELLTGDWLERLVGLCARDDVGAVGVKLLYPDDTIQHEGVALLSVGPSHTNLFLPDSNPDDRDRRYHGLNRLPQNRSAVTGACLAVRRTVFDEVGGFDPSFAVAYNDVDFCLRVGATGRSIVSTPEVRLYHFESVTRGYEVTAAQRERFERERAHFDERWGALVAAGDPGFNRQLAQYSPYYQLQW